MQTCFQIRFSEYDSTIVCQEGGGGRNGHLWYILLHLVHSGKIYLEFIVDCFLKIRTGLCCVSIYSLPGVFFLYAFCWNNEYILGNISRIWVLEGLEKSYIQFSNNTFPIAKVIINLFITIPRKFELFVKRHDFNDWLKMLRRLQKSYLIFYDIFWKIFCRITFMQSVIAKV